MEMTRWEAEKLLNLCIVELYDARITGENQVSYDWVEERVNEIIRYTTFLKPKIQQPIEIEGDY